MSRTHAPTRAVTKTSRRKAASAFKETKPMAKKKPATYAQQVTAQNDKFRADTYATHLAEAKTAARELKAARKAAA